MPPPPSPPPPLPSSVARYRRKSKKKKRIDYNAEIPFEKRPAPGFYDTAEDDPDMAPPDFKRLRRADVDGLTRKEKERVRWRGGRGEGGRPHS